jgi:hypothetical protein
MRVSPRIPDDASDADLERLVSEALESLLALEAALDEPDVARASFSSRTIPSR